MYAPVGQCIYCGATDRLSDEHIVPYGLKGDIVLPKASCPDCATITSRIERSVLRGPLLVARENHEYPSRRKRGATAFPLKARIDDNWHDVNVPASDHPAWVAWPVLEQAAFRAGAARNGSLSITAVETLEFGAGQDAGNRLKASELEFTSSCVPGDVARMIAKIGYCLAVAEMGISAIQEAYVLPAILGRSHDIGTWVGSTTYEFARSSDDLHRLAVRYEDGVMDGKPTRIVSAVVQLFSNAGTTPHEVIVGPVTVESSDPPV